jgi:replicative DNA helicase
LIVLGCQLSRDVEKRNDKRPVLSDLRDSWTIEQDADIVIMLYREDYYEEWTENKNKIELLVRKQRNWEMKTVVLDSKFWSYRIMDNWKIEKPF